MLPAYKVKLIANQYRRSGGVLIERPFELMISPDHPDFNFYKNCTSFDVKRVKDVPNEMGERIGAKTFPGEPSSEPADTSSSNTDFDKLGLDGGAIKALTEAGVRKIADLKGYDSIDKLRELENIGPSRAEAILGAYNDYQEKNAK
jgi:hypothetical protein